MSEWKEYKLGDLISIKGGFSYKGEYIGTGDKFLLGMGCVSYSKTFLQSGARPYSGDCSDRFYAKPFDIVLATRQQSDNLPILGLPAIIPQSFWGEKVIVGTNLYKVDNYSEVDNKYLYWLMRSPNYINYIHSCSKGSTVKMITKDAVESFVFMCPPKEERDFISGLLWQIEDKIDLLNRQNQTLESMAETLFRHYFIDNAQPDWKDGKLDKEFDFLMGQSPSGESFNEENIGIPMYQGNTDFGFRFPNNRVFTTEPKRFAEKFDTLISVRAPVGAQNMADEKCCIGRGVASFRYKGEKSFYSYTYYKMMSLMEEIKQFNESGTVFGSISKSDFENLSIIIPDAESIICFQKNVKPIDDKIYNNQTQINTLSNLRNTLLPKLMNGEVYMEIT